MMMMMMSRSLPCRRQCSYFITGDDQTEPHKVGIKGHSFLTESLKLMCSRTMLLLTQCKGRLRRRSVWCSWVARRQQCPSRRSAGAGGGTWWVGWASFCTNTAEPQCKDGVSWPWETALPFLTVDLQIFLLVASLTAFCYKYLCNFIQFLYKRWCWYMVVAYILCTKKLLCYLQLSILNNLYVFLVLIYYVANNVNSEL